MKLICNLTEILQKKRDQVCSAVNWQEHTTCPKQCFAKTMALSYNC